MRTWDDWLALAMLALALLATTHAWAYSEGVMRGRDEREALLAQHDQLWESATRALEVCRAVDAELHERIEAGPAAEVWRVEP